MGDILGSIFGKSPKVNTAPATTIIEDTTKKAKKSRSQVLATVGGVAGEELSGAQVSKTGDTLFGN